MDGLNLNEEKNEILGELDHLNSFIGLAKSFVKNRAIKNLLTGIQNDLFVIQANIADPKTNILPDNISQWRIIEMQEETYRLEQGLEKINHFIISEGSIEACLMHCVRTTARQVERKFKGYLSEPTDVAVYLDRLACLMFALARKINQRAGQKERSPEYAKQPPRKGESNER